MINTLIKLMLCKCDPPKLRTVVRSIAEGELPFDHKRCERGTGKFVFPSSSPAPASLKQKTTAQLKFIQLINTHSNSIYVNN